MNKKMIMKHEMMTEDDWTNNDDWLKSYNLNRAAELDTVKHDEEAEDDVAEDDDDIEDAVPCVAVLGAAGPEFTEQNNDTFAQLGDNIPPTLSQIVLPHQTELCLLDTKYDLDLIFLVNSLS